MKQYRICIQKRSNHKLKSDSILPNVLTAAFLKSTLWDYNDVIKVYMFPLEKDFTPKFTSIDELSRNGTCVCDPLEYEIRNLSPQEAVKLVVEKRIVPLVGLKIIFVDKPEDSNVRVKFKDDGAWAYVGTENRDNTDYASETVNFGWIDASTIMHEFGHVLGLIHEHQSSLGNHIKWDDEAVYKWASETQGWSRELTYENVIRPYRKSLLNGSDFDPKSIMLYFFPAELTKDKVGTKQNNILSKLDYEWFQKNYPMNVDPSITRNNPNYLSKMIAFILVCIVIYIILDV